MNNDFWPRVRNYQWFRYGRLFRLSLLMSSQLICNVTRTRGTGIVTLYSPIVLARANWLESDLHQWITTVKIDFSPSSIHAFIHRAVHIQTTISMLRSYVLPAWYQFGWNSICMCGVRYQCDAVRCPFFIYGPMLFYVEYHPHTQY